MVNNSNTQYKTIFHRDKTITVWNIFTQSWLRTNNPSDRLLSSLNEQERNRILKHCNNS